ncbi:hypothetical protein I546_3183 [Mycobacterium kansasii 732]|nr:hypothetical protein I546_3183 [Mycobacterium kansasii 732]
MFAQALAAAGNAYTQAEAAAAGALAGNLAGPTGGGAMPLSATAAATPPFVFPANYVTAFISGSGIPVPSADYMKTVFGSYVVPNFPGGNLANALGLWTPRACTR